MRAIWIVLALASSAAAETGFGWQAPAACPTADEVQARIEARLGSPLDGVIHDIAITIEPEAAGFVAVIDARGLTVANDIRTLRSARCGELADAIAVIVARLASEAFAAAPARQEVDVDAHEQIVVASAPAPSPMPRTSRASHTTKWGGGARLLGLSGIGALPRVNLGGELAAYARRNTTFFELAVSRWVPQTATFEVGAPAGVVVGLDILTVRVGWRPEHVPLRAWVSGEIGALHGSGMAVQDPRAGSGRWLALGAGFGVAWPMTQNARLVGTVELAVPLERTRFALRDGAELYRPSAAAARCAFGIEVGWP